MPDDEQTTTQPSATVVTPSGTLTREEYDRLTAEYPRGIPDDAVVSLIEERGELPQGTEVSAPGPDQVEMAEYGASGAAPGVTPDEIVTGDMQPYEVLAALRDAGADAGTIIRYIQENPDAVRGAEASRIVQGISEQYDLYQGLTGTDRIERARELGLLPDNFDQLPENLRQAFAAGDDEYNKAVQDYNQGIEQAISALEQYKVDGGYDIGEALRQGSPAVENALAYGLFTQEQIDNARQGLKVDAEFRQENTQLPDGQWINTSQLNELKTSSPQVYEALTTSGFGEADQVIAQQEKALETLQPYTEKPFDQQLMYESVKAGQFTVPEIVSIREHTPKYKLVDYLVDNPGGVATLQQAGFKQPDIDNAVLAAQKIAEYNQVTTSLVQQIDAGVKTAGKGLGAGIGLSAAEVSALGRAMDQAGIEPTRGSYIEAWRNIDDLSTKQAVAALWDADVSKGSAFAALARDIENIGSKNLGLRLLTAPIQPITSLVGKKITLEQERARLEQDMADILTPLAEYRKPSGSFDIDRVRAAIDRNPEILQDIGFENPDDLVQNLEYYNYKTEITPQEYGNAAVVAVLDILALGGAGALLRLGHAGRATLGLTQIGAGAYFMPQAITTILSPDASVAEKALAGAIPVLLIAGGAFTLKPSVVALSRNVGRGVKIAWVRAKDLAREMAANQAGYFRLHENAIERIIREYLTQGERTALVNLIDKRLAGNVLTKPQVTRLDNLLYKATNQFTDSLTARELAAIRSMAKGYAPELTPQINALMKQLEATGGSTGLQGKLMELPAEARNFKYIPVDELRQLYSRFQKLGGGVDETAFFAEALRIEAQRAALWQQVANDLVAIKSPTRVATAGVVQTAISRMGSVMPTAEEIAALHRRIAVIAPKAVDKAAEAAKAAELRETLRNMALESAQRNWQDSQKIGDINWSIRYNRATPQDIAASVKLMSDDRINERLSMLEDQGKADAVRAILGVEPDLTQTPYIAVNSLTNEQIARLFEQLDRAEIDRYLKYLRENRVQEITEMLAEVNTETATATELREALRVAAAVKPALKNKEQTKRLNETETALAVALANQVETEVLPETETETAVATETATEILPAEETAVETAPEIQTQVELEPVVTQVTEVTEAVEGPVGEPIDEPVEPAIGEPIPSPVLTPTPPTPKRPYPFLWPYGGGSGRPKRAIPAGSYAWRQGAFWRYVPPPYNDPKPLALPRGVIPLGAVKTEGITPQETIQIIGHSRTAQLPDRVNIDMGVTDVFITRDAGGTIQFSGGGLYTDAGGRLPSPTVGMDLGERIVSRHEYPKQPRRSARKKPTKNSRRQRDDFTDILSVRGI